MDREAASAAAQRLGIEPGPLRQRDVRNAYRTLALQLHPDVGGSSVDFRRLNADYVLLRSLREGTVLRGRVCPNHFIAYAATGSCSWCEFEDGPDPAPPQQSPMVPIEPGSPAAHVRRPNFAFSGTDEV